MEKIILKQIKQKWIKAATRRMSYQKLRLYHNGLNMGFKNIFGKGQKLFFVRMKKGVAWTYAAQNETEKQLIFLENKLAGEKYIKQSFRKLARKLEKDFTNCAEKIKEFPQNWKEKTNDCLVKALEKYYEIDNSISAHHWILFNDFENFLTQLLVERLSCVGIDDKKIQLILFNLSKPSLITPLDMERLSLFRIALLNRNGQKNLLSEHQKKFSFLPMYDIDYLGYSLTHFKEELVKIRKNFSRKKIKKEIKNILERYSKRERQKKKILEEYGQKPEITGLMNFYAVFAAFKDKKPYARDQISSCVKNLFLEIAQRLSLSLTQALFLTETELREALLKGEVVLRQELDSRINNSAFLFNCGKVIIFTEKSDLAIIDSILEIKKEGQEIIKGIGISPGLSKAPVSIIISNNDFKKFKNGQILVTSATRPDFVPLMKKASAVITDEGGLLSHAAIISRELGIPCIVGTKVATQILKDGDLIEVDANKGVVKILKRK